MDTFLENYGAVEVFLKRGALVSKIKLQISNFAKIYSLQDFWQYAHQPTSRRVTKESVATLLASATAKLRMNLRTMNSIETFASAASAAGAAGGGSYKRLERG